MEKENMDKLIKKVACINDISCLGGASLTEIIPVLSSMGIRTLPVPTVVLSTHSGGYDNYTYHNLTDHMVNQKKHWKDLGLHFDSIFSGFLGSVEQIKIVEDYMDTFSDESCLILVDPVMGDHGEIYSSIDEKIVSEMKNLVKRAHIVTPNLTEAFLLVGEDYDPSPSKDKLIDLCKKISAMGPKDVIITSALEDNSHISNAVYTSDKFSLVQGAKVGYTFPGTGDIFASTLLGLLLNGHTLLDSVNIASDFIYDLIDFSKDKDYSYRSGVLLEARLHKLYKYNKYNH